jgi:glyoxylase-like metal-dependent hydrolase (beta-lactamase superfamily II)
MIRIRFAVAIAIAALSVAAFRAPTAPPDAAYKFQRIADGVYSAIGTGSMNVGSNSAVIVNQDDVLIVDSHISPESARAMLSEIKTITDKPVRFLVNTHFHYDHTNGNQVFAPAVDIIGHEYTRARLARADYARTGLLGDLLGALPKQVADLNSRAAAETDPAAKARLAHQAKVQSAFAESMKEFRTTPPNVTLQDRMTLYRGGREIQLLYLGRGHTGGDVVVYLPKERVLCTGDLLVNQIANLIDGFVNEWPDTLEKLKPLDFDDVIPGHGDPFKGKERIAWFQAYLRDLWQQASKLHDEHVPAAEAAKRIDMTAHKAHYASITGPGINPAYVARIYAVIEKRAG